MYYSENGIYTDMKRIQKKTIKIKVYNVDKLYFVEKGSHEI